MAKLIIILILSLFILRSVLCDLRIANGTETDIFNHPWQVSITIKNYGLFHEHKCGGSIIDTKFIITAAHCVKLSAEDYSINAGTSTSAVEGTRFDVKNITIHPNYDVATYENDIAIMELNKDIKFGSKMNKIELADVKYVPEVNQTFEVTGYGKTCHDCGESKILMKTEITFMPIYECERYKHLPFGKMCAREKNNASTGK